MKTIMLTDKEARIASIEIDDHESGQTTVTFEWGGPDDRDVVDFDVLSLSGESHFRDITWDSESTGKRNAWVIYHDGINSGWKVGDTIPLLHREFVIEEIGVPHGVKPDRGGGEGEVKTHWLVNGVEDGHETHRITLSHAIFDDQGEVIFDQVDREVWAAFEQEVAK